MDPNLFEGASRRNSAAAAFQQRKIVMSEVQCFHGKAPGRSADQSLFHIHRVSIQSSKFVNPTIMDPAFIETASFGPKFINREFFNPAVINP
jgi:hypothetical protein